MFYLLIADLVPSLYRMTKMNKHIPIIGFVSELLRLETKIHQVKHCVALVKVLTKRFAMFYIASFSFVWLELYLFYPSS